MEKEAFYMELNEKIQVQDTICNMVKGVNDEIVLKKLLTYVNHAYINQDEGSVKCNG